jgi:hypothetical protein
MEGCSLGELLLQRLLPLRPFLKDIDIDGAAVEITSIEAEAFMAA